MKGSVNSWVFQPLLEKMSRDQLSKLQEERLKKLVRYCYDKIPIYREKFKSEGITPDDIKTLEDLDKIPFTEKEDLRKAYPQFTVDEKVLNEDTQLLCQYWGLLAAGLAKSQSAGLAGSLITADWRRAKNAVDVIEQLLDEIEQRPVIDLPETAFPGADLSVPVRTTGNLKKK